MPDRDVRTIRDQCDGRMECVSLPSSGLGAPDLRGSRLAIIPKQSFGDRGLPSRSLGARGKTVHGSLACLGCHEAGDGRLTVLDVDFALSRWV